MRFGAAGLVGTFCFGLFLLPGGLPRRFGSGAAGARVAQRALLRLLHLLRLLLFGRLHLIIRGQDITRTTKTTREADVAVQVGQAEAHVPQGNRAPEGHEVRVV